MVADDAGDGDQRDDHAAYLQDTVHTVLVLGDVQTPLALIYLS